MCGQFSLFDTNIVHVCSRKYWFYKKNVWYEIMTQKLIGFSQNNIICNNFKEKEMQNPSRLLSLNGDFSR